LLAALPQADYDLLAPALEYFPLPFQTVLHQPRQPISHVYFPTSCVVSLLSSAEGKDGGVEAAVVGQEGMASLGVFLGVETTVLRCAVQAPGEAWRMRAEEFRALVRHDHGLHRLLLRYTQCLLAQVSQSVACVSMHRIEKRLCRWLLGVLTRLDTNQFPITHEYLAAMLGVRRASVTDAARGLRQAGLIRYGRGQVTVLDREALEDSACSCHRTTQAELKRLQRKTD
jgi:hypothetical protein